MKPVTPFLILLFIACCAHAQSTRIYLDRNLQSVTDTNEAVTQVILSKYAEDTTLWVASQYTMSRHLIVEGVYKDRELTVPNGPFKYYVNADGRDYLAHSGYFFNGVKYGEWIDYYQSGKKMKVVTVRGNEANGLYEIFTEKDTVPVIKGYYVKGKKDGEWTSPAGTDTYKDGVKIKSIPNKERERQMAMLEHVKDSLTNPSHMVPAIQPAEFAKYMEQKIGSYFRSHDRRDASTSIVIEFIVDEKGKLSNGKGLGKLDEEIQRRIVSAIDMASPWVPATLNGKPIKQKVHYMFTELASFDPSKRN
jgi:antitoxin component YwqK of YwqJK toxin-antitoxin module